MDQNSTVETEKSILKLTSSCNQLTHLPNSHIHQQNDNNTLKKVMSMNCNEIRVNHKDKMDQRAFTAKLNIYKSMQKKFVAASNSLKLSYETLKNLQMDLLSDKNQLKYDEPEIIVKENIEKIFGIKFPKLKILSEVNHQIFVPNLDMCLEQDIKFTSGHLKFDSAIQEAYEEVRKIFLEISETNIKYHYWLKNIIKPNEFNDLCDVRRFLMQHLFNKEHVDDQLESKLKHFYNNLQLKLINIVNEVDEILKNEKCSEEKQDNEIRNNCFGNLETNAEVIIEDYKQKMNIQFEILEMENKNLKEKETELSKQIETLFGQLTLRNKKLIDTKNHLSLLMKEKNDLICLIKKMEIKEEGFQTLQNKFSTEKKKNEHLRAIIAKEYETDDSNLSIKKN